MSVGEKIDNLIKVKKNLEKKLRILAEGRCIVEFDYVTPSQWRAHKYGALQAENKSLTKTVKTQMLTQQTLDQSSNLNELTQQQQLEMPPEGNPSFTYDSDIDENEEQKR